jgi:DNA-binding winged helix-turn-helix (wHTH) protein
VATVRFGDFALDPHDRRLTRAGAPVEVNARYFDALALLVERHGQLVTKDDFMARVWRGVPVTDEALTQCIRTLRRLLDDDAAAPRYIATVPKHGYRFVAAVDGAAVTAGATAPVRDHSRLLTGAAGTIGGAIAGLIGGVAYGSLMTSAQPGTGLSLLAVMVVVTVMIALVGGAAVAFGAVVAERWAAPNSPWIIAGAAAGGMAVGALFKLFGLDALAILLGTRPGEITGAREGLILGAAVGLGIWLPRGRRLLIATLIAAACGAGGGALVALFHGRLLAGSLDQLASNVAGAAVRLDGLTALVGEDRFGPTTALVTAMAEGALFAAGVAGAIHWVRRGR